MYDPAVELEDIEDIDLSAMALSARRRLQLSLMDGEATEALRWLKIFETLSSMAPETPAETPPAETRNVHRLHPVFTPPDPQPLNRAERRRLRRAGRLKPPSASGESRASQGP